MRDRKEENAKSNRPRRGRWSQAELARLRELYGLRDDASIARDLNRPLVSVRKMAEKLFPEEWRSGPWDEDEVERLKLYLGASEPAKIGRILGRDEAEVRARIAELARVRKEGPWTRDEIARFKKIYGTRADADLALIFGRPVSEVERVAERHALAKDKAFTRKREGEDATRMPRWTAEQVELLRELYPDVANLEIAQRLGRTVKSVVSKAHNLGLRKSNERLQRMGRENVSLRYHESSDEPIVEVEPAAPPRRGKDTARRAEPEPGVDIPRPRKPRVDTTARDEEGGEGK